MLQEQEQTFVHEGQMYTKETKALANIEETIMEDGDWRQLAKEDFDFAMNKQWSPTAIQTLRKEGRPYLTLNLVKGIVRLLFGLEKTQRFEIKYHPVHDADRLLADVYNYAIDVIMNKVSGYYEVSMQFLDAVICGRGFINLGINFDRNLVIGEPQISHVSPFNVMFDPNSRRYDLGDAGYIFRVFYMTQDEVVAHFPSMGGGAINALMGETFPMRLIPDVKRWSDIATGSGSSRQQLELVPLVEYWYRITEGFDVLVDEETGRIAYVSDDQRLAARIMVAESNGRIRKANRRVKRNRVKYMLFLGSVKVDEGNSPLGNLDMFPIIPMWGEFTPSALTGDQRHMGVVRSLKDPQREINKRRSQVLHIINTMAHSGYIADEGAFVDENVVKQQGSRPGIIIYKRQNKSVEQIKSTPINRIFWELERSNMDNMKQISLVNPDLLGQYEANTPGVAMRLRQQQGITGNQDLFDNMRQSRKMLGRALVSLMHTSRPDEEIVRMVAGQESFLGHELEDILGAIQSRDSFDYDVVVSESPSAPSQRLAQFLALSELKAMGINIPDKFLIEALDLSNKEEILEAMGESQEGQGQENPLIQGGRPTGGDFQQQATQRLLKSLRSEAKSQM